MCVTSMCDLSAMEVPLEHQQEVFWEFSPGQHREHFRGQKGDMAQGPAEFLDLQACHGHADRAM